VGKPLLIRGARQLLTLRGPSAARRGAALKNIEIIADGALLINDGVILEANSCRRVEALAAARNADEINAHGCVVLPGFVDSHTHLVGCAKRGLGAALNAGGAEIYYTAIQTTSQRTLKARALRLLEEFARHGTTTVEAKSGFGETAAGALKILRAQTTLKRRTAMVSRTFMGTRWEPLETTTDGYVEWMCTHILPIIKQRGLAEFADIACGRETFSPEQARRYLTVARQIGLTPKMHAGQYSNPGGVAEAIEVGAASVDHLNLVTDEEIKLLACAETIGVLLPGPVFFTDRGKYAPARKLIDGGAAVALATGYNVETSP
jgi:imidazolonepropionase